MTPEKLRELYEARLARARNDSESWGKRSRQVSNLRGVAFLVFAGGFISVFVTKEPTLSGVVAGLGFVAFVACVAWHGRVLAREDAAGRAAAVNGDAVLRASGRFRELAEDGKRFQTLEHPYADDLDLFGRGSLYQRLSVAHTRFGEEALSRFLSNPAPPDAIAERQRAVRALAPELDLRQRFEALSFAVTSGEKTKGKKRPVPDPGELIEWAKSHEGVSTDPLLSWGARLAPVVTLAGFVIWTSGHPPFVILSALLLQFYLLFRASPHTTRAFVACSSTEGAFRSYGPMLRLVEGLSLDAPLVVNLKERLLRSKNPPSTAMARLERILGWFELRHNGLVYPFVNLVTLWDIHCTLALERWRNSVREVIADWFEVLGELEALSSLAGLAHDEPGFAFPEITSSASGPLFVAEALGHPLIPTERRVTNDVLLETKGSALLVTGSNMSGKSTLLRAMGDAAVLAYAGAPVCARRLRIAPLTIRTSVRVSDSLERGVSHFYAEVKKLGLVLEASRAGPVLFLLDEILHGTNSRERQIGARWLIAELIGRGAVGAVSTHDEELCRLTPELMSHVRLVHFREQVANGSMTFDYLLREGPVKAGNALRVMQLAGLDVPLS